MNICGRITLEKHDLRISYYESRRRKPTQGYVWIEVHSVKGTRSGKEKLMRHSLKEEKGVQPVQFTLPVFNYK